MKARAKALTGYIFPALGGLFVTYLYNVVDGIFVGQGVGSPCRWRRRSHLLSRSSQRRRWTERRSAKIKKPPSADGTVP